MEHNATTFHYFRMKEMRAEEFRTSADPLFFKWQRGEGTEQAWLDAVAAVRDRYPYVDVVA